MTDRDVVERVANLFGRAVVRLRRRRPHHKLPYVTTIKGTPAVRLMCAVRPFLGKTRQRQIDRAVASWQPRRGRVRSPIAMALSGLMSAQGATEEACDRAWLAGLLEGEGSFITHQDGRLSYPVIKVEMCDLEVMERVADLLKTRLGVQPSRAEGWRPTYVARIAGHRAADWRGRCERRWAFGEQRRSMRRSRATTLSGSSISRGSVLYPAAGDRIDRAVFVMRTI
jgi:hypothetical protein